MTQTKQHHSELLQLQTNAEKTNTNKDSSPLIEREQIPNTPFWIIGNKDDGYHIIMGKYRITNEILDLTRYLEHGNGEPEIHLALTEAQTWLENNQWNVILSMALIAITETPNIIKPN